MKIYIVFFITFFITLSEISGQKKSEENLFIKSKIFDFGNVKSDTLLNARYYLINNGKKDIKINYVNPECSCTSYFVSNYVINPNDSIYIDLFFDTRQNFGEQKIYAIVNANTKAKMYKLTLKANIKK